MSHDSTHPAFLAHHFEDAEQQYDAGKLAIWIFLVTEVLFFSGMFCAYALYRSRNPEVFQFASQYLNATLGAFNTGVLLFSSLSMAWGVRCAQLRQRTGLVISLAITLGCAAMFLGIKAVEYTHKWDIGLLPAGHYVAQPVHAVHHEGLSEWLYYLSAVPAIFAVGLGLWYVLTIVQNKKRHAEIAGPLLVTALCYFVGVFIGIAFQNAEAKSHADHADAAHATESVSHEKTGDGPAAHAVNGSLAAAIPATGSTVRLVSTDSQSTERIVPGAATAESINQPGGAGLFFSIYYCMTGVHAIHILGGMAVLAWLLVRATKDQFHEQYFGPVDYVGLYWHLVDLIWIYLFPLLYLIK